MINADFAVALSFFLLFPTKIMLHFVSIMIVSGVANYWIFLPMVFVIVAFVMLRSYYLRTSREMKRLEAVGEYIILHDMIIWVECWCGC